MFTSLPRIWLDRLVAPLALLALLCLEPAGAAEQPPISVDDQAVIDIVPHLMYWRTNRGALGIEQVERAYQRGLFNENNGSPFSLPRTRDGIWLRFILTPREGASLDRILEFRRTLYDRMQLYVPTDSGYQRYSRGYDYLSNDPAPALNHNEVPVRLRHNDLRPYYLYLEDSLTIRVPVKLWQADALARQDSNMTVFLTAIFTTMLAFALYNLLLFSFLHDSNYLRYSLYMLAQCLFLMTRDATIYQLSWISWPQWGVQQLVFCACLAAATAARFNQGFVNLAHYAPGLNRAISFTLGFLLCIAALCLFNIRELDSITASIHNWANFILAPLMVLASFIALRKGNRQARWFLAGWLLLISATFIASLSALGLIGQNLFTLYGIHVAAAMEAIILSIGLADRINIIRRERDQAEQISREVDHRVTSERKRRHKSDAITRYLASIHSRSSEAELYRELVSTLSQVMEIRHCALLHSNTGSIRVYSLGPAMEEMFSQEISGRLKLLEGVSCQGEAMILQHRSHSPGDTAYNDSALVVIPLYSWRREWSVILIQPEPSQEFSQTELRQASHFCEIIKEQILNYRRYRVTVDGTETEESGVLTRTALLKHAQRVLRQWNKHEEPLCIAQWTLGDSLLNRHPLNDEGQTALLKTLVECCHARLQRSCIVGRYGQNEIMMLLPGHDPVSAEALLQQLYDDLLLQLQQQHGAHFDLSLEVSVAHQRQPTDTLERLTRHLQPLTLEGDRHMASA
ncbi:sensor domain-containing diguanylate cyclase [Aestuariirhabdus litorea]|nr:7TM diverse intracellular signaling domain-containing protein [Aestuariirhabdus litorea]